MLRFQIDDTFIAYYQMSYGFTAPASASTNDTPSKRNDLVENEVSQDVSDLPDNLKRKAEPEPASKKWPFIRKNDVRVLTPDGFSQVDFNFIFRVVQLG